MAAGHKRRNVSGHNAGRLRASVCMRVCVWVCLSVSPSCVDIRMIGIKLSIFVMNMQCVCCEVGTEFIGINESTSRFSQWAAVQAVINPLTPNDTYRGRTAPLTSKRCILYIYSTNIGTEYFKHDIYSPFFFSLQNAVCFIILTYLVPVLFTFYIQVC